jgi:hypothetical protein
VYPPAMYVASEGSKIGELSQMLGGD